jgi:hypothetical protein
MIKLKDILKEIGGSNKAYHTTSRDRLDSILKDGLKINSKENFSVGSLTWMKTAYKMIPIFVSFEHMKYKDDNSVFLEVDISGIDLVADIPSLVDLGAYVEDDYIWFESGENIIDPIDDPEQIFFDELTDPYNEYCEKAIEITETAAVMEDIPPSKIKVVNT